MKARSNQQLEAPGRVLICKCCGQRLCLSGRLDCRNGQPAPAELGSRQAMAPPAASHSLRPGKAKEASTRTRKPHSKSRRGCGTCKIRHYKCDEGKPSCNRCLSVGLRCDGYAHHDKPKSPTSSSKTYQTTLPANMLKPKQKALPEIQRTILISEPGLIPFAESEQDKKCFEFFRVVTIPKVFNPFNEGFWSCLLLQLSHTEQTTWHSLLAFASITERQRFSTATKDQPQALSARFALKHYARAVELLTSRISRSNPCIEVLLSSCYLFFALEMFLGNIETAIIQIQGGLKLMHSWQKSKSGRSNSAVDNLFNPMLNVMFTCALIYGREVTLTTRYPSYPSEPQIPRLANFETSYSAIVVLVDFTTSCWQIAREFDNYKLANNLTDYDIYLAMSYGRRIRDRYREWRTKFERIIDKTKTSSFNSAGLEAVSMGKAWCTVSSICIQHKFGLEEKAFDAHVREFEESLEIVESLIKSRSDPKTNSTGFPFLMAYFSQVYLIAIKCRHQQIRRRALADMKNFPIFGSWNSGFWDPRMMATVIERVVEIEEEGLEGKRHEMGSRVPSEWARIHDIRIPAQSVNNSNGHMVQFRSRVDGQWVLREEVFKV
ncbi:hypothetical protein N431DRAFT_95028 [Stipitochalara longipes BDJ]|nr:hypothetical protein N431DRAFT_95028 [Stipitochalara longipes BDJ]